MSHSELIQVFLVDESGVTAIEYALIGSLIAMAVVTTVAALGLTLEDFYKTISAKVEGAISG